MFPASLYLVDDYICWIYPALCSSLNIVLDAVYY